MFIAEEISLTGIYYSIISVVSEVCKQVHVYNWFLIVFYGFLANISTNIDIVR